MKKRPAPLLLSSGTSPIDYTFKAALYKYNAPASAKKTTYLAFSAEALFLLLERAIQEIILDYTQKSPVLIVQFVNPTATPTLLYISPTTNYSHSKYLPPQEESISPTIISLLYHGQHTSYTVQHLNNMQAIISSAPASTQIMQALKADCHITLLELWIKHTHQQPHTTWKI